ncbi:receiver box response regulator [Halobacterium hubeiense]|uniref:Receiver box response regulator n=1 Tax=Halobacterium hubeiense TaxID=1407499 RepID=A0A0U5H3J2_9EURY|nr:response regulator [Halobacterium hubeiense]CQH57358.1 receiver box response regulator [Halobacterium hubeiense]
MIEHRDGDPVDILLVEDNPGDVRLTREAFAEAHINNDLHDVNDGEAALDFLHQRGDHADAPRPDLILLDLNLPKVDGLDVLEAVKSDDDLRTIPVVVLTSSEAEEDVARSYEQHTNAYLTKPIDPNEFVDVIRSFERFWLTLVELPPTPE